MNKIVSVNDAKLVIERLEKMLLELGYSKLDAKKTAKLSVIKGVKK